MRLKWFPGPISLFRFFGLIFGTPFWSTISRSLKLFIKLVQNWSQNQFFFRSALGGPMFRFQSFLRTPFCSLLASWGRLGGGKREKNADSPLRKPLFRTSSFCILELYLLLLGSFRSFLGWSCGSDGSQKTPKSGPKLAHKLVQNLVQCWAALGLILGPILGRCTTLGILVQCSGIGAHMSMATNVHSHGHEHEHGHSHEHLQPRSRTRAWTHSRTHSRTRA